jgi:hypothetical protein
MATVNSKRSLTVLAALMLGGTALVYSFLRSNENAAYAQPAGAADFSHVEFSGVDGGFYLFDRSTGNVFVYPFKGEVGTPKFVGRMTEPGKPLARDQK